jgi:nitroimidazol reductase NimA-like FMN-containing flavoprotein (pyridoxamine 5'-phosphate oxidase superfamily)
MAAEPERAREAECGGERDGGVAPSERTRVRRAPQRARYDRETVEAILDEGVFAHVGFAVEGRPFVIPMVYGRRGDVLYLHGSPASRLLRAGRDGVELCLTVTHLDGIVLARSAFHTSVNYRSVVLFARAVPVDDAAEKLEALRAVVDHAVPGRWSGVRGPDETEFRRTLVLKVPISEASAKVRTGPPVDDESDMTSDAWAGVIPVQLAYGEPLPDPQLRAGIEPTPDVAGYRGPGSPA